MTEKTLASPKPSEIPIANNFKKVFRQYGGKKTVINKTEQND